MLWWFLRTAGGMPPVHPLTTFQAMEAGLRDCCRSGKSSFCLHDVSLTSSPHRQGVF